MGITDTIQPNADSTTIVLQSDDLSVQLPSSDYIRNSEFLRDGTDLVLHTNNGDVVVQDYFITEPAPYLIGPDGASMSPPMVLSFLQPAAGSEYADTSGSTMNDASPIGVISEITGEAHITRTNGTIEKLELGSSIHQGDIVETNDDGALNITFVDETSFAISEDTRLSIDEYVFDPATAEGTTNFSVLKGMFVFTSGMIGREDPDDVMIETPQGSIGIRGTIIAGDVNQGEITVVEGAIVLRDMSGNEMTLATQFETAKFDTTGGTIQNMGQMNANDVAGKFAPVSGVSGTLFSSINDAAVEDGTIDNAPSDGAEQQTPQETQGGDQQPESTEEAPQKEGSAQTNGETTDTASAEAKPVAEKPAIQQVKDVTRTATLDQNATLDSGAKALTPQTTTTNGGTKAGATLVQNMNTTQEGILTTAPQSINTQPLQPTTTTTTTTQPLLQPFQVNVNVMSVNENTNGATLAQITGLNTSFTNVSLLGPSAQYYEIFRIGPNRVGVRLQPGIEADYEGDLPNIEYRATNADGTRTLNGSAAISLNNVNEAPEHLGQLSEIGLSAGASQTWHYNFAQDFVDPDSGDNLIYAIEDLVTLRTDLLAAGIINATGNIDINSATGEMTLQLNASAPDEHFNFTIIATDQNGLSTEHSYTFNVYEWGYGFSATEDLTYNGVNVIASGTAMGYTISGNDNIAMFSAADDILTISGAANSINMGDGEDSVTIAASAQDNTITGGNGNDDFDILNIENEIYGDSGNDTFTLELQGGNAIINNLTTLSSGVLIDGGADTLNLNTGSGGDILRFTSDGNPATANAIDFTQINDNFIKNIEILGFANNDIDHIRLSYSDVIAMTDENNTLVINGDAGDTLDFINGGHAFQQTGTLTDGTETMNIFTNGEVTLYIHDTIDVTAGLPAV